MIKLFLSFCHASMLDAYVKHGQSFKCKVGIHTNTLYEPKAQTSGSFFLPLALDDVSEINSNNRNKLHFKYFVCTESSIKAFCFHNSRFILHAKIFIKRSRLHSICPSRLRRRRANNWSGPFRHITARRAPFIRPISEVMRLRGRKNE